MSTPCSCRRVTQKQLSTYGGQTVKTDFTEPCSRACLSSALNDAQLDRRHVVFRGGGRSFDTQSLNDTLVVSMARFKQIGDVKNHTITVGPSARWGDILKKTVKQGCVPYVMVTSRSASAGGTLSADCLSRFSPSFGKEGVHIRAFKLMRIDGTDITCSRDQHPDVFKAVISGLGCLGAVFEITYDLIQLADKHIAVETTVVPFTGIDQLASKLVQDVDECQNDLCACAGVKPPSRPQSASVHIPAAVAVPSKAKAVSCVLYLNAKRQGLLMRSNYVRRRFTWFKRCVLHQPWHPFHLLLQVAALFKSTRRLGWYLALKFAFTRTKTYVDELFGYTFFQDGNERLKRLGRSLCVPLGVRQQTYVIPYDPAAPARSSTSLQRFLERADRLLDSEKLLPALIDVLYVPDDAQQGFCLSSSRAGPGFAVTFSFEKAFSNRFDAEEAALKKIVEFCDDEAGRVHFVKHVYADQQLVGKMYARGIQEMVVQKDLLDPGRKIQSAFVKRVLPPLA